MIIFKQWSDSVKCPLKEPVSNTTFLLGLETQSGPTFNEKSVNVHIWIIWASVFKTLIHVSIDTFLRLFLGSTHKHVEFEDALTVKPVEL